MKQAKEEPDARLDLTGLSRQIEDWASWFAVWMVYWANNKPENKNQKPKVGGHQASAVSSSSILTAHYLHHRRPQDRIAVKPHAAPFLYSLMYMMGRVSRDEMENLRELDGLPAYPTQHHHPAFVDYSTSIEGLGCSVTVAEAYEAIVQNTQFNTAIDTRYHALVGDGELTELQIGGSIYEAGRRQLSNLCWWIDVNRQSLDRVMEDSPNGTTGTWVRGLFEANGWHVIDLRWGSGLLAAFDRPGGITLRKRLESMSDSQYQSLLLLDGSTIRKALTGSREHEDPTMQAFVEQFASSSPAAEPIQVLTEYSDDELKKLVEDLGGHDLKKLIAAEEEARSVSDRPTVVVCHTIKGWRLPKWAGHPENHGAILSEDLMDEYRNRLGFSSNDPLALPIDGNISRLLAQHADYLFPETTRTKVSYPIEKAPAWNEVRSGISGKRSSSAVFGNLNLTYLRSAIGKHLAFIAPDVGLTTHMGGVIRASGVFDPHPGEDLMSFLRAQKKQLFEWRLTKTGQFHSVAINEGVATLLGFAMGREKFAIEGKERLIPIITIYDVFWKHAYTQLYYALYDNARFIAVGTPSGTSLSRESGTHQSIQTPALFMGLPNIIYYEPAFAIDTQVIYHWAIDQLMSEHGESVYLRLTTQDINQPEITDTIEYRENVIRGGYWYLDLRNESGYRPGQNVASVFATGPVIVEAELASNMLREHGIFVNVCNVTSWERLKRDWEEYWNEPKHWEDPLAGYHLNELIPDDEMGIPMVVVGDFTPQVADWIGGALGQTVPVLAPRDFSETGSLEAIRALHGINAGSIERAILAEFKASGGRGEPL